MNYFIYCIDKSFIKFIQAIIILKVPNFNMSRECMLILNTDISFINELLEKYKIGSYLIFPVSDYQTSNNLWEMKKFEKYQNENLFKYLDELKTKEDFNGYDKAFFDTFKDLFDYDVDALLDKMNKNILLSKAEKYWLDNHLKE